jgi:hypothetical protein
MTHATHSGRASPRYGRLAVGAMLVALGMQTVRHANENYDAIRDGSGIGAAAGLGLAGVAALLIGVILLFLAFFGSRSEGNRARRASGGVLLIFSLLGFAIGAAACLNMFMAAAARFVTTEKADQFSGVGVMVAFLLAFIALFFGLVGLFLRGYGLGRVPLYFVLGAVLTFAAVRLLKINLLEWQPFIAMLQ